MAAHLDQRSNESDWSPVFIASDATV